MPLMSHGERVYAPLFAAVVLVGVGLRAWTLSESLWLDELHTAWCVADGWDDVAWRARLGNNSPPFFYGVFLVTRLFGMQEWSLRLVSLAAGIAVVPATYLLARSWRCCILASCLAASLMAVDANFLFYSREARTYALVQLVSIVHIYCFTRLVADATPIRRAAWVLTAALLFYLHYTTALLLASEVVAYGVLWLTASNRPSYRAIWLVVDLVILILLCLPATGHLQDIAQRRVNWELFIHRRPWRAILALYPLHTYVLLPLALVTAARLVSGETARSCNGPEVRDIRLRYLILAMAWLVVPLVLAWTLTQTDLARVFFRRYLIASSVAPAMMTALIVNEAPKRWLPHLSAIVLICGCVTLPSWSWLGDQAILRHSHEDWRGAVAYLNASSQTLPVFLRSGLIEADQWHAENGQRLREFCLLPVRGLYRLDTRFDEVVPLPTSLGQKISANDAARAARSGGAWLLLRGTSATRDAVIDQFVARLRETSPASEVTSLQEFGRVTVARIEIAP